MTRAQNLCESPAQTRWFDKLAELHCRQGVGERAFQVHSASRGFRVEPKRGWYLHSRGILAHKLKTAKSRKVSQMTRRSNRPIRIVARETRIYPPLSPRHPSIRSRSTAFASGCMAFRSARAFAEEQHVHLLQSGCVLPPCGRSASIRAMLDREPHRRSPRDRLRSVRGASNLSADPPRVGAPGLRDNPPLPFSRSRYCLQRSSFGDKVDGQPSPDDLSAWPSTLRHRRLSPRYRSRMDVPRARVEPIATVPVHHGRAIQCDPSRRSESAPAVGRSEIRPLARDLSRGSKACAPSSYHSRHQFTRLQNVKKHEVVASSSLSLSSEDAEVRCELIIRRLKDRLHCGAHNVH